MRFDDVLPHLSMLLREEPWLEKLPDGGLIVNRDLFGKVPPTNLRPEYLREFNEKAHLVFIDNLYDEVPPDEGTDSNSFTFDLCNEEAPHFPWPIYWHEGLLALREFHTLPTGKEVLEAAFAAFFKNIDALIARHSTTL